MVEQLVLMEFADETEAYLKIRNTGENPGSQCIIPLSLAAQLVLKKKGIPYENTLSYFDSGAHSRSLVQLDQWLTLLETFGDMEEGYISEVCFCLRPVFSYLLWAAEIIAGAVKELKPAVLLGPRGRRWDNDADWKMVPGQRPLGFLMEEFARVNHLRFQSFGGEESPVSPSPAPGGEDLSPPSFLTVRAAGLLVRLIKRFGRDLPTALITTEGYGMGKAMERMKDEFHYFSLNMGNCSSLRHVGGLVYKFLRGRRVMLPVRAFPYHKQALADHIKGLDHAADGLAGRIEGEWRARFQYETLDFAPYVTYMLRTGIRRRLVDMARLQAGVNTLLNRVKPAVVLTPFSSGIYTLIGETCRRLDIPAVMVSHATHLPPRSRLEEIEQRWASRYIMMAPQYRYTVAQSPWAVRHAVYFGQQGRTLKAPPVILARTDPARGLRLRSDLGIPAGAVLIVYAVAQRKRSSIRFHAYETEDEYLQDMKDLVLAVNRMENTYLILKLHPSSEFSEADMRTFLPSSDRLFILHREPFNNVLSAADVLVSYSSTVIEEALANRIPVVQYDRWNRYCHLEAFDCNKGEPAGWAVDAIYYAGQPDRLAAVLKYAFQHAQEAADNDKLYEKHLFGPGQSRPLVDHIKQLLSPVSNV